MDYKIHLQPLMGIDINEEKHWGKELVRHAITRFATHFLTLQCLNSQQKNCIKCFLLMIRLNLGGLIDKMEKTPRRKYLTIIFVEGLPNL